MKTLTGTRCAWHFKYYWMALACTFLLMAGVQSSYSQTYRVTYNVSTNVTGSPYTFNRVLTMNIGGTRVGPNDFVVGDVSGSYDVTSKPSALNVSGYQYSGSNAQSTQTCYSSTSHPLNVCVNPGLSSSLCGSTYSYIITIAPIVATTGPTPDPNKIYCPDDPSFPINLSATGGFSSYTWQYRVGTGAWQTISRTTGNSTGVTSADIGGNYLQNIYFQALAEDCAQSVTTAVGPYVFSPGAVYVPSSGYTDERPRCKGGNNGKIIVTSLSRALTSGETVIVTLKNSAGVEQGQTVEMSALPITLDGGDLARFPNGISPGSYKLLVESYVNGQPSTCGVPQEADALVNDQTAVVAAANVSSNYNGAMISCLGQADGAITITASGGVGGFKYSANGGTTYQDGNVFSGLGAGSYTYTVKDANQCTATTTAVTITPPSVVSVSSAYVTTNYGGGAGVSCHINDTGGIKNNGSIKIEASGGTGTLQYSLAGGTYSAAYQDNSTITSLYVDTYTVSVRDQNGCPSADHPVVPINSPQEIVYSTVVPEDLACNGVSTGRLEVQGAAGGIGTLQYSLNGSSFQVSNQFSYLSAGSYTVTIRDTQGCTKVTGAVPVDQPPAITFSAINISPQSCTERVDGSITLAPATGGTGPRLYSIDDITYVAETSSIQFTNLASANYTIYVEDSKDCKITTSQFVGIRPAITGPITVSQPISCNGENDGALNLTPGGGSSPYVFNWSTLETTEDVSGKGDGLYSVTITDSKSCEKTFEYDLQAPQVLALQPVVTDLNGYGVSCKGSADGSVNVTVQGGTAPFTYSWSTGSLQEDVSGLSPGKYDVYVTDAHNCKASALQIDITEPPALTLSLARFKDISCKDGVNGELEGLATGGAGYYEYSLDGTTWQPEALFTGLSAQLYTLRLKDGNGCSAISLDKTLTEPSQLLLSISKQLDTSCGESNGSATVEASGGAGGYQYAWYDVNAVKISGTVDATGLPSGDYQASVLDGNNCPAEITVIINDSDGPKIAQQVLQGLTCHDSNDGAIGIGVSEGLAPYTILWDTQESTLTINNVTGGSHWVEVLDSKGCRDKEIFNVPYPPALAIDYTATMPLCTGNADGSIGLNVTGGNTGAYDYAWSTGETTTSLSNLKAGTYHITVKDSKDCTLAQDIVLTDPPLFTVDAGGDRTICVGQKLTVRAQEDDATYEWKSDAGYASTSREVVLTVPSRYTLKVVNSNGCVGEDSFTLATSNDLLKADFLMADEAHAGDTVVLIDISWPVPESISWSFPADAHVIIQHEMYADVVFADPGLYEIMLTTRLGECIDNFTKTITVLGERSPEGGREGTDVVKRFEVYPNPSDGAFSIIIEFADAVEGSVQMLNMSGTKVFLEESLQDQTTYTFHTALQHIPSGIYFLILEAGTKTYSKRIAIK